MFKVQKKRVTSIDVAKYVGFSRATVSKVLNNPDTDTVRPETKKKILRAAQELGYRKNLAGRSLMDQKAYTIGLLSISNFGSFLFSETAIGMFSEALKVDYRLTFCGFISKSDQSGIRTVVDFYRERGIDGAICLMTTDFDRKIIKNVVKQFHEEHIPFVFMNSGLMEKDADDISPDYYQIGRLGTDYLLQLGHKHIAFVAHEQNHQSMEERLSGYRDALNEFTSTQYREEYVVIDNEEPNSVRTGYWSWRNVLMKCAPRPTAVYAFHENNTAGVVYAAEDLGLKIPDDLSIMGTYHNPQRQYFKHAMTSVVLPLQEVGRQAVKLLMKRINNEGPNHAIHIRIPGMVKLGETCLRLRG